MKRAYLTLYMTSHCLFAEKVREFEPMDFAQTQIREEP